MKLFRTAVLLIITLMVSACASAVDEAFDYSSYNSTASYSDQYFNELAQKCSPTPNLVSTTSDREFRACKPVTTQVTSNILIFSENKTVQKMCVIPVKRNGGHVESFLELKLCGTIAFTGSSAVIENTEFNGLLMVDSENYEKLVTCLTSADYRACAIAESFDVFETSF